MLFCLVTKKDHLKKSGYFDLSFPLRSHGWKYPEMRFRYIKLEGPGPFGVPEFWFKKMTNLHGRLAKHLQACVNTSILPTWMTKDKQC